MWMSREFYVLVRNTEHGILDAECIFVNCINQNGTHIDEYGYNIRVELLGIVTWFQVDSDQSTEVKE